MTHPTNIQMFQANPTEADTDRAVALAQERLTHLLPQLLTCKGARRNAAELLPALKVPANPAWLMARIAALLSPYFEKETPQAIRKMEADDWAYALEGYPKWAIENAVRWWKSADNPDRRKRPVEGDIEDRIRVEMQNVRNAEAGMTMQMMRAQPADDEKAPRPDAAAKARADEIMARFNKGKGFPK